MKIFSKILLLFFAFPFTIAATSCNKDTEGNEVITINGKAADSMTLSAAGETKTVVIKGTQEWQLEAIDWVTATPASGAANIEITVSITAAANTTGEERIGGVAFKVSPDNEFVELVITQLAE